MSIMRGEKLMRAVKCKYLDKYSVEELMSFHKDDALLQWFSTIIDTKKIFPIHYK